MTYKEATTYLFDSVPMFQNVGGTAYKEGLSNTLLLDEHFGHPHRKFKTIHVGGTNGKGSCSHTLAAILQTAGYKVGLYTSPHLTDFRERIRVNGKMIPECEVVSFVEDDHGFGFQIFCEGRSGCGRYRSRHGRTLGLHQHHYSGFVRHYQYQLRPCAISGKHPYENCRRESRNHPAGSSGVLCTDSTRK